MILSGRLCKQSAIVLEGKISTHCRCHDTSQKYHRSYLYNTPNSCYDNHIFGELLFSEYIYSRKALISGFNFRNIIRYEKQQKMEENAYDKQTATVFPYDSDERTTNGRDRGKTKTKINFL